MTRRHRFILLALAFLASAVVYPASVEAQISASDIARAQRDAQLNGTDYNGGYGTNPFENPEEENPDAEVQDSTKKKRPRLPLESYYFNDSIRSLRNWKWYIDRDYNRVKVEPLDTTLADWRIDYPFYRRGAGDMALGGLGQSTQPVNWFERRQSPDFIFARSYDAYTARIDNVPFYNGKTPLSNLMYIESGQKRYREEHFELVHSQNVSPSTSANISYKARSTMGKYEWQRTKNHALSVAFAHTGKRYSVHAAYMNNMVDTRENGGVVGEWAIVDTTFEMPSGVPMRLTNSKAHNKYRNNDFFIKQAYAIPLQRVTEYDFSLADLSAVYIGHQLEYNAWTKTYTDIRATYTDERGGGVDENGDYIPVTREYYDNWYINPYSTRDSISERLLSNKIFIQAQPWDRNGAVGTLDGGVGVDLHTYSHFSLESYASGKLQKTRKTSWYVYGSVNGKIKRYVDWQADAKYYPSGYRGSDLSIGGEITLRAFIREHPLILTGRFRQEFRSPSFWQENLFSNHYVWFNSFSKEKTTRFEARFSVPDYALELGLWQGVMSDMLYYDSSSDIAQASSTVSLTSLYARKDFRIAGLHLDHRALVQFSSDEHVLPVPLLSAFVSYYYDFWAVRDVLRVQIGLDCRYNTSYYAPSYNPALSVFFNQRDVSIGSYPYVDAFISAKWKRMRILLKFQHLNNGLFGNRQYFQVARYPLNPFMFKMGISWSFYD